MQSVIEQARSRLSGMVDVTDNDPLLIMCDGEILHDNLRCAGMTSVDLVGKLREANALEFSQIRAVVFEPTGDVSILHGERLNERLLDGVR